MSNNKMKSDIAKFTDERGAAKPHQAEKWTIEQKRLSSDLTIGMLHEIGVKPAFLKTMALYAVQKIRKMAAFAAGERTSLDPMTTQILTSAAKLAREGVTFTPALQQAALSKSIECSDPGVAKLPTRSRYSKGTAMSQANTTRQALLEIGAANVETVNGTKNCLVLNDASPVIAKFFGKDEAPAEEGELMAALETDAK